MRASCRSPEEKNACFKQKNGVDDLLMEVANALGEFEQR